MMGNVEFESSNDKVMIDKIKFFFNNNTITTNNVK